MSELWPSTIGTIIGGFVSIVTTVVIDCIRERKAGKLDSIRTERLRQHLSDKRYEWRTLDALSDVIGADRDTTVRLLLLMNARKSQKKGQDLWTLSPLLDDEQ
jgi:hypothetical protein